MGRHRALLALLVVAAAALRFWALGQGLPFTGARPDEREVLQYTAGFPSGDLNPRWFIYPNLFFYVVWLWEELVLGARRLWVATPPYAVLLESAMPRLILSGRALSAGVGTATVLALYAVGRRAGGARLGLVAAALLAACFLHVRDSHGLKPDVPLALGVLGSVWALARYAERPTPRRALAAGVLIGVTAGLKYNGLLLLPMAWVADLLAGGRPGWRRLVPRPQTALLVVTAIGTFVAVCPFLLLDLDRARRTATFATWAVFATRPTTAPAGGPLAAALDFLRGRAFGYHLDVSLRRGFGLGMTLALPLALVAACRVPRRPLAVIAATFSVFYYLVAGLSPVHLARYVTPLTPLLALLVAGLVCAVATRPAAIALLTVALAAEPLARSVAYDHVAARPDTRVLATEWMAAHLPVGAVVARLGSGIFPVADPDLPAGVRDAGIPPGATDLSRWGVTHVVVHWHHELLTFSRPDPTQLRALAPRLRLLAEFSPYRDGRVGGRFEPEDAYYVPFYEFCAVERPGPLVQIYAWEPTS